MYKVKEVAALAGVSVRTLHHYDEIGLLKPAAIGDNGYRMYSEADLERLQQILFFKELELPLQEVRSILDDSRYDRKQTLALHKELLLKKKHRLEQIIQSVEQTLQSIEGGYAMSKQDMFEPFDMKEIEDHQKKYEQEVQQRWGSTDAYKESARKTAQYTEEDWKRIKAAEQRIYQGLIDRMSFGPDDEQAQAVVASHRQHITDNFYTCSTAIYRGLGDMYVNDPRFTKNIDKYAPGLAAFMREAIHIHCDRVDGEPESG
ncbi:transcriptional regulator, MerR family [Paenibacillus curdlanolyticus YK9]|uniref:Transcriptional regulator, MerR family n=1 Tax=Paenibacillus curdlanolyticus YK9 TaxID=717606 RepID=E0I838_9BACL|nr:MerR family transcriptional regulator [Paenibacillus curdlanolyticus]EFM11343.1 transcriptional regulator, MerR family [Paenibacillus curdlanolyticus YK9]